MAHFTGSPMNFFRTSACNEKPQHQLLAGGSHAGIILPGKGGPLAIAGGLWSLRVQHGPVTAGST